MKKQSAIKQARNFDLRPASVEEAGLFYTAENQDTELGTVGHLRMDFDSGGKGFYHTWWPHNGDRFNTPEFQGGAAGICGRHAAERPTEGLVRHELLLLAQRR